MTSHPDFDPYCPSGGSWYACGNGTQFAGCCGEYPCIDGCSAGQLYSASFSESEYATFSDQQCSGGKFYTCTWYQPAFLGCCKVDACATSDGCPSDSLAAMYLSGNPSEANAFDPQPPLAGSTSSRSSSTDIVVATAAISSSSIPSSTATSNAAAASTMTASKDEDHTVSVGAVAGGAIGGFAFLCAILFTIWRVKYHSKRSSRKHSEMSGSPNCPAQDVNDVRGSNGQEKWVMAAVVPVHSSYQDLPPTAPPYSPQHSSQPWCSQMYQRDSQHPYPDEVENRSAYRAYSPQTGTHTPYGPPTQVSPSISHPSNRAHSDVWGTNSALDASQSQYESLQFARSYQGPPQEMAGSSTMPWAGPGVHRVSENNRSRAELSGV